MPVIQGSWMTVSLRNAVSWLSLPRGSAGQCPSFSRSLHLRNVSYLEGCANPSKPLLNNNHPRSATSQWEEPFPSYFLLFLNPTKHSAPFLLLSWLGLERSPS